MDDDRRTGVVHSTNRMPPGRKLTYAEFLEWCDEDTRAEWVHGEVVMDPPASRPHQRLSGFLYKVLDSYVELRDLGEVVIAPFQMKTGPDLPGREPDLLFVAREHLHRLQRNFLDGPADLAIEISSAESWLRDTGEKFAEYQAGGVREYWRIDPDRREADFYQLGPRGRYRPVDPDPDGWYTSPVLAGFRLNVSWLWADPLPKVLHVLRELGVAP